ncbi:MAG: hypothetical protein M1837_007391 [Sclerophora amabilis]|nr:MAG: hypothetical protein M1837_007391 [Sclerophora amabilis]
MNDAGTAVNRSAMTLPRKSRALQRKRGFDPSAARVYPAVSSKVWKVLARQLQPPSEDSAFWWQMTGSVLGEFLAQAGYDLHSQYESLLFHFHVVAPRLGPRPTLDGLPRNWKSFMTDDFSPIEYSWKWGDLTEPPEVRYSLEAIGPQAGTVTDPFNEATTMDLVHQLHLVLPNVDWQWFYHFVNAFRGTGTDLPPKNGTQPSSDLSTMFLAFELQREQIVTKAYFRPVKVAHSGNSPLAAVSRGIRSLEGGVLRFPAHDQLVHFMKTNPEGTLLDVVLVAIDCVEPSQSRLKTYVRSPHTSFDSVCTIMTLGNTLRDAGLERGLEELRELWQLVMGLDHFCSSEELDKKEHQTAGVLYYFDIKPGNAEPVPKVYIPVRHYGRNDLEIVRGLGTFLKKRGRDGFLTNYLRVLDSICTHRSLESGPGIQTYISCSIKNGALSITSYVGPEIYHRARWSS